MVKILSGKVISIKMQKTAVIMLERKFRHPLYKKVITKHKKVKAHNEDVKIKVGDKVRIKEVRPMSKDKNFVIMNKI